MFRRNTVVIPKRGGSYGRVVATRPCGKLLVVCCGKYYREVDPDEWDVNGYTGNWRWQHEPWNDRGNPVVWRPMPTLRQIKQMASGYNPDVWKKPKRRLLRDDPRIPYDHAREAFWAIRDKGERYTGDHFAGRRLDDHNTYKRWEHLGCLSTMYAARHKPYSLRGRGWEIYISNDYTERVQVRHGCIDTILGDLALLVLSADLK